MLLSAERRNAQTGWVLLLAAALGLGAGPAWAAPWELTPRVSAGVTRTDNINLEASEFEESDWITELRPGFMLSTDGPRAKVDLNYDLQALWFSDNSDFNDAFHQANGSGTLVLAPESLFLDAFARLDQQNVDTSGRVAYNNIFQTDNRTDAFVYGASPYHVGRWGTWAESTTRYQYQGVRYRNTDEGAVSPEDSDINSVYAAFGNPRATRGFRWSIGGRYSLTEFDEADEFEFARVALDAGVPVSLRTRLTATVGQESDVIEDPTKGGLDSSFWLVGFAWEPSDLESLEARIGERFFGTTWEVNWNRRGSRGELGVSYVEEPTTSAGVQGDEDVFNPDFRPGGAPTLDTRVFLQRRFIANASYKLVRTSFALRLYSDRREYVDATGDTEEDFGATLVFDWDAAARTRVGATIDWQRVDFSTDRRDDLGEISLRLGRDLSRVLSGELRASHFRRNSDTDFDYRANLISLLLQARF